MPSIRYVGIGFFYWVSMMVIFDMLYGIFLVFSNFLISDCEVITQKSSIPMLNGPTTVSFANEYQLTTINRQFIAQQSHKNLFVIPTIESEAHCVFNAFCFCHPIQYSFLQSVISIFWGEGTHEIRYGYVF